MDAFTIITGALGGLGSAFALECAERMLNLILIDRLPQGNDLIQYINEHSQIKVRYISCNLANHQSRMELIQELREKNVLTNGLINVVGQEIEGPFLNRTREEIHYMLHLNIETMIDMTLAALQQRDPSQRFILVNTASLAGFFPMPYKSIYAASKRFIINFSLALREEIRDFGNVTVLCPGGLPTNAEAMKKIFLQGFWGKITAHNTSFVVKQTMNKVIRNVPIYIPGAPNKMLVWLAHLLPEAWIAAYLARRWGKRQEDFDLWRISDKNRGE